MDMSLVMIGVGAVLVIGYFIMIFNNLVALKNNVKKSWSNIEVLLKQRNSELPKLVETCKQYMSHERGTLEEVIAARNKAVANENGQDMKALGESETMIRMGLGKIFALAESYPDLKANDTFNNLQKRIANLEDQISDRREFYNDSVNNYNIRIEQFPDSIIANMKNFKQAELLQFSAEETKDVDVKGLFNS